MNVDLSSLRTLLSVNGLSPTSPEADIRSLLERAKYSPEEIAAAVAMLSQQAPAPVAEAPIAPATPVFAPPVFAPLPPNAAPQPARFSGVPATASAASALTRFERITGIVVLSFLSIGLLLLAQKTFTSLSFITNGYKGAEQVWLGLAPYVGGAFGGAVFVFVLSWFIARLLYRSRSYALWLSLVLGIYIAIWFLLFAALPFAMRLVEIPSGMGFAYALIIGFVASFVHASVLICCVAAAILSIFLWNRGGKGKGVLAQIIIGVIAVAMLVVFTGVLKYPAKLLGADFLCYGVLSSTERGNCFASSFSVSDEAAFDVIPVSFSYPHAFSVIGGKFVFVADDKEGEGIRTLGSVVYVDGVRMNEPGLMTSDPVDAGDGRVAYIVSKRKTQNDTPQTTLYIDREEFLSAEYIGFLTNSAFSYMVRNGNEQYVVEGGEVVVRGSKESLAYMESKRKAAYEEQERTNPITMTRDEKTGEMTYSANGVSIVYTKEGIFADGEPVAKGLHMWPPSLAGGKLVFGVFGSNSEGKMDTYIVAEKGLISDEVRERIEAK